MPIYTTGPDGLTSADRTALPQRDAACSDTHCPVRRADRPETAGREGDGRLYAISVSLTQTPWELISQVASYEGLLVRDDAAGDLVICRVGTERTASGFREGDNLQGYTLQNSDEMLFSTYVPVLMSKDSLSQIGPGGNGGGKPVADPEVKRYRPLIIVSDQNVEDQHLAQKRAVWEATCRRGRSQSAKIACDSWRDKAGKLWTHNVLASPDLPIAG